MAPVLALVVQSFIKYVHDLVESGYTARRGQRLCADVRLGSSKRTRRSFEQFRPCRSPQGPKHRCWSLRPFSEALDICWERGISTIADFDLGCSVSLCNILDAPHDLGHGGGGGLTSGASWSKIESRLSVVRMEGVGGAQEKCWVSSPSRSGAVSGAGAG